MHLQIYEPNVESEGVLGNTRQNVPPQSTPKHLLEYIKIPKYRYAFQRVLPRRHRRVSMRHALQIMRPQSISNTRCTTTKIYSATTKRMALS